MPPQARRWDDQGGNVHRLLEHGERLARAETEIDALQAQVYRANELMDDQAAKLQALVEAVNGLRGDLAGLLAREKARAERFEMIRNSALGTISLGVLSAVGGAVWKHIDDIIRWFK